MLKLRQEMVEIARENNMGQDGIEFLESCGILQSPKAAPSGVTVVSPPPAVPIKKKGRY